MKTDLIVTVTGHRFVDHVEDIITKHEFNLTKIFDPSGYHGAQCNATQYGIIKLMGYKYDLRKYLKRYVIKTYFGDLIEIYALNKTNARKLVHTKVNYILEVTQ
jgi:uncharacterized membrane protein